MEKTKSKYDYIWVILLILFSGNPLVIFSAYVREFFVLLFLLLLFIVIFSKDNEGSKALERFVNYVLPIVFIIIYHFLVIPETQLTTNLFVIIKIFVGVALISLVGRRFPDAYVSVMCVFSIISLFFFAYINVFGLLPGIPIYNEDETVEIGSRTSLFFYTQFVGESPYPIIRNTGMFWEAGAHQGFLNLALLLMARLERTKENRRKKLLLIVTILTTMSTTGYIVLMLVLAVHIICGDNGNKKLVSRLVMLFILFIIAAYAYVSIDFLGAKVTDNLSDTSSSQGRVTDYFMYSNYLIEHFFLGNSYNVDVASGNGFFYQLICIGFIGTSYLMYKLYRGVKLTTDIKYACMFVISLIVMYQGEGFLTHPLFLALPFIRFPSNISAVIRK